MTKLDQSYPYPPNPPHPPNPNPLPSPPLPSPNITPPPTPSCPSAPRVIVRVSPKGFSQSPTLLYPPIILYQTQRAALTLCDGRYGPVEPPLWRYFQPFIKPPIDETEDWEYHLTE